MTTIPNTGRVANTVNAIANDFASLVGRPPRASVKDTVDAIKARMPTQSFQQRARLGNTLDTMETAISGTMAVAGTAVTTGTENVAYAGFTATASGGIAPYVYSLVGTWPTGLSVNASSGAVSGTPTEDGAFTSLSVRATDNRGKTADLAPFTLTIAGA